MIRLTQGDDFFGYIAYDIVGIDLESAEIIYDVQPVYGLGGNDGFMSPYFTQAETIHGGAGDDAIQAGKRDDVLRGGAGNDVIFGGSGADTILAGTGTLNAVSGEDGDDLLVAGEGGSGDGGGGADTLRGGAGDNLLTGGAGDDVVTGGGGDDTVAGGSGADRLAGGAGVDTILLGHVGPPDPDAPFEMQGVAIELRWTNQAFADAFGATDTLVGGFENAIGTLLGDTLTGSARANQLVGGAGDDSLSGLAGDDALAGGAGDDTLLGGAGKDSFVLEAEAGRAAFDLIRSFTPGEDRLEIAGGLTLADLQATQLGTDVRIVLGDGPEADVVLVRQATVAEVLDAIFFV